MAVQIMCAKCEDLYGEYFVIYVDAYEKYICHRCANALIDALRANQKDPPE